MPSRLTLHVCAQWVVHITTNSCDHLFDVHHHNNKTRKKRDHCNLFINQHLCEHDNHSVPLPVQFLHKLLFCFMRHWLCDQILFNKEKSNVKHWHNTATDKKLWLHFRFPPNTDFSCPLVKTLLFFCLQVNNEIVFCKLAKLCKHCIIVLILIHCVSYALNNNSFVWILRNIDSSSQKICNKLLTVFSLFNGCFQLCWCHCKRAS